MGDLGRVAVITGLLFEQEIAAAAARRLGRDDVFFACAANDRRRAASLAADFVGRGADTLISFGVCGALDRRLRAGASIIADAVVDQAGEPLALQACACACDHRGTIVSVDDPLSRPEDKAAKAAHTCALAVDVESYAIARSGFAAAKAVIVARVVLDEADDTLPPAATHCVASNGAISIPKLVRALAHRPQDLPGLVSLGRRAGSARAGLGHLAERLFVA